MLYTIVDSKNKVRGHAIKVHTVFMVRWKGQGMDYSAIVWTRKQIKELGYKLVRSGD